MPRLKLTQHEREVLQETLKHDRDAQVVRRAQALLWHDGGEAVSAIARRLRVTRQTVYNWFKLFHARQSEEIRKRLQDLPRPGRPPRQRQRIEALIRQIWMQSAATAEERPAISHTATALQRELARQGVIVHERTIRRTLRRLHYHFQRPHYVLIRNASSRHRHKSDSS